MKADYLTYKRARNTSLLGLVIQLLLGLILLVYSIRSGDHAAQSGSYLVLLGVFAWLILAILFDQYRRERVEALEADSFAAADAAASSVFEEGAGELRIAAKRLATFNRFVVPATSLLIAAALLAIGYWRFSAGRDLVSPDNFVPSANPMLAMVLGLALGFVGFILARFVSGMSTQTAWRPLSAGAGFAVASALVGASIAVGHFVEYVGNDSVLRYLNAVIPAVMIGLGLESIANFVWDLYRPRKPGELPRAAFDSRFLGAIAAPDLVAKSVAEAIDYWLGSDRASTWLSELLRMWLFRLVMGGLVTMWLLSSLVVVQANERAMILRSGSVVAADVGPGLHLKMPWPIGTVVRKVAGGVQNVSAGAPLATNDTQTVFWTGNHHAGRDMSPFFLLVQPSPLFTDSTAAASESESSDLSILIAEVPIEFTVGDLEKYIRVAPSSQNRMEPDQFEAMLESVARREVMLLFASLTVDEAIDTRRNELSGILKERISKAFEFEQIEGLDGAGAVDVSFVGVVGIHPPEMNVSMRFEQVIEAQQNQISMLEDARAKAAASLIRVAGDSETALKIIEELDRLEAMDQTDEQAVIAQRVNIDGLLNEAGGEAAAIIHRASAQRWALHMGARTRAQRYQGQLASYEAAPEVYIASLWFDTLKELMSTARVYITGGDLDPHIVYDLMDKTSSIETFLEGATQESP
jgi:modulator of FtsH protease HflK